MTNSTFRKYMNLYVINKSFNDLFDEWLRVRYTLHRSTMDYGRTTFTNRRTGEPIYDEATIMFEYIRGKNPYFKDSDHLDEYLNGDDDIRTFFAKKGGDNLRRR